MDMTYVNKVRDEISEEGLSELEWWYKTTYPSDVIQITIGKRWN